MGVISRLRWCGNSRMASLRLCYSKSQMVLKQISDGVASLRWFSNSWMLWQVFGNLQYEICSTLFVVLLTNFMLNFHELLVRNGKKKGMTIQAFWDGNIDHVSKPIITWRMGCFFFFFLHLWSPQHFLNHGLLLLQAFMKSSTFPWSWASSSSSSSICEIFNISSIMGFFFFFFFKHLWNPQHFLDFIIYQKPLSSSQVPLCLWTCSMLFFFYLLQMFKIWEASNSLHLANSTSKTPLKPLLLRKAKSCTSFNKDMLRNYSQLS